MTYDKQPTDITTQLAMLKQRGLIVSDEDAALRQLASISYFRLASYWKIFEIDENTHRFASGTRLEDVISLYHSSGKWAFQVDGRMSRCGVDAFIVEAFLEHLPYYSILSIKSVTSLTLVLNSIVINSLRCDAFGDRWVTR